MATDKRLHEIDLDLEIKALYENIIVEEQTYLLSQKQATTLASLMSAGLNDRKRENRISVLNLLVGKAVKKRTGFDISSTKNIPGEVASFLIDLLIVDNINWELSTYGKQLLSLAEKRIKATLNKD